ncbi:MAG: hypothetical protein PWQ35_234 [Patescibacteria group bacterium]|nr:hypothetical protein [Patescibacteria group bacterium]
MAYSGLYARFYDSLQKIGHFFARAVKFAPAKFYLGGIFLLQILAWWQAINIKHKSASDWLVLHYNIDFGVDLLGTEQKIFLFPLFGLLIFILNFLITTLTLHRQESKVLAHLLYASGLFFNVFLNLALFSLFLFNFQ